MTGLIAIMLAQRSEAKITAIEIDENAYLQAKENTEACQWSNRLKIKNISFQDYYRQTTKKYSLIVSNPPYFVDSLKAPGKSRATARHTDSLTYNELLQGVVSLLAKNGWFCVVLPVAEGLIFIDNAKNYNLFCTEKVNIKPNFNKNPKRLLLKFGFQKHKTIESILTIETDKRHCYTDEYKKLTKDFYLAF